MKLISPAQAEEAARLRAERQEQAKQKESKLQALQGLNEAGQELGNVLERAYTAIGKQESPQPALALMSLILGTTELVERLTGTVKDGIKVTSLPVAVPVKVTLGGTLKKRGRGRPKGSKNKKTLEREAEEKAKVETPKVSQKPAPSRKRNVQLIKAGRRLAPNALKRGTKLANAPAVKKAVKQIVKARKLAPKAPAKKKLTGVQHAQALRQKKGAKKTPARKR